MKYGRRSFQMTEKTDIMLNELKDKLKIPKIHLIEMAIKKLKEETEEKQNGN